jgi:transcriptional regulator with GAF, ATPase, and Fis domain
MVGAAIEVQLTAFAGCEISAATRRELCDAGLAIGDSGPEIIFFDHFDPELAVLPAGRLSIAVAHGESALQKAMVPLLRAGVLDVLEVSSCAWATRIRALLERHRSLEALMSSPMVRQNIEGQSQRWRETLRQVVALSQGDASMLFMGETGTGKDLLARLVHGLDPRPAKGSLVVLDCTTLVAELSGSELFGHERGAFTGALTAREGVIAQAENGTLFLDEIGELPLAMQAQLLRVIQERSYRRVGSDQWRTSTFRLLCATNRDLEAEVQRGRFRADLYYRIAASTVRLPALRERRGDVLPLARFFLQRLSSGSVQGFDRMVEDHLLRREFPGNVRELKQLVGRAYHRWVGPGPLGFSALPEEEWDLPELDLAREFEPVIRKAISARTGLKEIARISRELAVQVAVEDAQGNLQRAAALLGVTDRALQIRRAGKSDA